MASLQGTAWVGCDCKMFELRICAVTIILLNLVHLGHGSVANWCPWTSEVTCMKKKDAGVSGRCSLYVHRVCACPEPPTGGDYCSTYINPSFLRKYIPVSDKTDYTRKCLSMTPYFANYSSVCGKWPEDTPPWCGWTLWGPWSATCGRRMRLRQRQCKCSTSDRPSRLCGENRFETVSQDRTTACPRIAGWCAWSDWTEPCTCDNTESSERIRLCKCPYVKGGCFGPEVQKCTPNCPMTTKTVLILIGLVVAVGVVAFFTIRKLCRSCGGQATPVPAQVPEQAPLQPVVQQVQPQPPPQQPQPGTANSPAYGLTPNPGTVQPPGTAPAPSVNYEVYPPGSYGYPPGVAPPPSVPPPGSYGYQPGVAPYGVAPVAPGQPPGYAMPPPPPPAAAPPPPDYQQATATAPPPPADLLPPKA